MRRLRRLLAAALVAAAAGVAASGTPAHASGSCAGVWVVVDPAELGGETAVRCAEGEPASGFDALLRTGFTITPISTFPGFLCQIDGRPESSCRTVPPATAYWSYWHAEPGGGWTSATQGGATRRPPVGTADGWAFGAGDPPSVPPPAPAVVQEPEPDQQEPAEQDPRAAPEQDDPAPSEDAGIPSDPPERPVLLPGDPRLPRARHVLVGPTAGARVDEPAAQDPAGNGDTVLADERAAVESEGGVRAVPSTAAGVLLIAAVAGSALLAGRARRRPAVGGGS